MKSYNVHRPSNSISEIEITESNEDSIWFINSYGRRVRKNKKGAYDRYFDTYVEAKAYLESELNKEITRCKSRISTALTVLEKLKD